MILLLGGTSESVETAKLLVDHGFRFIFSMATGISMDLPESSLITVSRGAMDDSAMEDLINENMLAAVVDATHPYAVEVTENAMRACENTGARYFRLSRDVSAPEGSSIIPARDHEDAANKAADAGKTVLSTIGVRNLGAYVSVCSERGIRLIARALPNEESLNIIKSLGIPEENIITGKGPFSFEENVNAIRKFGVGVVVTKDSGTRGGTDEKIRAAIHEGCRVILVQRPEQKQAAEVFTEPSELLKSLINYLGAMSSKSDGVTSITML